MHASEACRNTGNHIIEDTPWTPSPRVNSAIIRLGLAHRTARHFPTHVRVCATHPHSAVQRQKRVGFLNCSCSWRTAQCTRIPTCRFICQSIDDETMGRAQRKGRQTGTGRCKVGVPETRKLDKTSEEQRRILLVNRSLVINRQTLFARIVLRTIIYNRDDTTGGRLKAWIQHQTKTCQVFWE